MKLGPNFVVTKWYNVLSMLPVISFIKYEKHIVLYKACSITGIHSNGMKNHKNSIGVEYDIYFLGDII